MQQPLESTNRTTLELKLLIPDIAMLKLIYQSHHTGIETRLPGMVLTLLSATNRTTLELKLPKR